MEYSAVSQPPVTPCSFIHRGTASSIVTAQITRVLPIDTSTEPLDAGRLPAPAETGLRLLSLATVTLAATLIAIHL